MVPIWFVCRLAGNHEIVNNGMGGETQIVTLIIGRVGMHVGLECGAMLAGPANSVTASTHQSTAS